MAKINANKSKYSKGKKFGIVKDADIPNEDDEYEEDSFENEEFDESEDDFTEEAVEETKSNTHLRSNGLFQNLWWKKGVIKGFLLWLVIVVFFYVFALFGLVEVIAWKRWAFFLVFLIILGMTYEKFFYNKIKI
jgi:hypothetical protein